MSDEHVRVIDVHKRWMPKELLDTVERCLPDDYRCERTDDGRINIIGAAISTLRPIYPCRRAAIAN
jgi:hypothetical protein